MARDYLITFDLSDSANRRDEYRTIRNAIRDFVGPCNYFKSLKQCCLVRTNENNAIILGQLVGNLVDPGNVLVLRLRYGYATDIVDPVMRQKTRDWLRKIRRP